MITAARVKQLVLKELRQMFRDPRMARVIFIAPIIQLVVFGYAVNTDVRHTPVIVLDQDQTRTSRDLLSTLTAAGYFRIVARASRPADLRVALDHGRAVLALNIPPGFARDLRRGEARVQILVDGTSSNTANVAQGYAASMVQAWGRERTGAGERPGIVLQPRVWYNPALESRVYNVPAVAGVIIMLMCLLLTALSVVREREMGTLEQLMVSPLRPAELILGKTVPVALVGLVDLALITSVALLWFGIPFRGSAALLLVASATFIVAGLGMGLLISTISSTQQEAFMTMFLVFLPMMLFSGFMFPVSSMPRAIQWLTLANPLRYFLEIIRSIFLKGAGLPVLWPRLLVLALMAGGLLTLASLRFRKRTV